jgi:Uma2 family endonuclease
MSMSIAEKLPLVSAEDYLAGEEISPVKHEYLGGVVHAMSGAQNTHNVIAGNIFGSLWNRLRSNRCKPFNSDTKIRIRLPTQVRFYYPDVSISCQPNPGKESFQDHPIAIFEVLSRGTRRIDDGEKKDAYLTIPSLCVYALVEQDTPAVVLFRRTPQGFVREVYADLSSSIPLPEIKIELPLAEVYEGVQFIPEPDEDGDL